ncbi:MAG: hypothetical protein U9N35_03595 [Euryarchaeota archaeon]|nr:hypothetical protein [Euryarchaeota archaeon]
MDKMTTVKLTALCIVLAILCMCVEEKEIETLSPSTMPEKPALKRFIEIKAEGEILHYQRESFWSNEEFSELLEVKEEFEAEKINSFKKTLEIYNRSAVNPKIDFNKSKKSTTLFCDIEDAKEGSWFDFDWFLRPYGLDFLDSNFERKEKELYRKGEIDGVETVISIKFPYPISNCHEHVWPR